MKKTHKQILLDHLRQEYLKDPNHWIAGFKLQGVWLNGDWSSHKADTRLREMAKSGEVERSYDEAGYAQYRYKESPAEQELRVAKEQTKLTRLENQLKLNI